ncbi:MAG TPA: 6-phosphofructokinase, partial [Polyangiaceae bacterium]|nr:6-phosphofructokinase [Polyangiaceae bacterium]
NVITLPKTIDNDVYGTDISFGFDTAMSIATEAIDRLHTTATSHNRMIVCEVMGHTAGWLALGAGVAGGADVILVPEIPYDLSVVADHLLQRRQHGKRFSIIAVSEAARSVDEAAQQEEAAKTKREEDSKGKRDKRGKADEEGRKAALSVTRSDDSLPFRLVQEPMASRLARRLQQLTDTEARVTSLGHVQRGGGPTPTDRMLCTLLGVRTAELLAEGTYNVMVAIRGNRCEPVALKEVAGKKKTVPLDHDWLRVARSVGTCLGRK